MSPRAIVELSSGTTIDRRTAGRRARLARPSGQAVMSRAALADLARDDRALEASRLVDRWFDDDPEVTSEQANAAVLVVDAYVQWRRRQQRRVS